MTPIQIRKTRVLDPERMFRMYFTDMGSARSLAKVVNQLGMDGINPNLGRPVTPMAVEFSIYRWAMGNLDLSYEIYNKAMLDEGKFHTMEEWKDFLQKKAVMISKKSNRAMQKWLKLLGRG
jgi:hypothetical protein